MKNPFRGLMLNWHRIADTRQITLDGVRISTDSQTTPRSVRSALFKGTYESHERKIVRRFLKPEHRVLEIGTGIGLVSLVCARICGAEKVLSYEANLRLEPIIRSNYALNGLTPNLHMRAITVDGNPITFFRNDNVVSSSTLERGGDVEKVKVESDRLDNVLATHRPDVVIMDVEGAEISLLSGSTLAGVKHIIVEIHPHITGEEQVAAMMAALKDKGFEPHVHEHKTIMLSARTRLEASH